MMTNYTASATRIFQCSGELGSQVRLWDGVRGTVENSEPGYSFCCTGGAAELVYGNLESTLYDRFVFK